MKLNDVVKNIKKIDTVLISDFVDEITCAFKDYDFKGITQVIVNVNGNGYCAYINHVDSDIIEIKTQEVDDKIVILDAYIC